MADPQGDKRSVLKRDADSGMTSVQPNLVPPPSSSHLTRNKQKLKIFRLDRIPEIPPRREIVEGLFAEGELVMLVSPPGIGKSALAQYLLVCIAEGGPFLSRTVKQGPVLYVAAERYESATRRLNAMKTDQSAPIYIIKYQPNLADKRAMRDLGELINEICREDYKCGPTLICIDTFSRCIPGVDENSAKEMSRVMQGVAALLEQVPSAAVMIIHHTAKNSSDSRGSSVVLGAVDLEMLMSKTKNGLLKIEVQKANDVEEGQLLYARLVPVALDAVENADPISVVTVKPTESEEVKSKQRSKVVEERSNKILALIKERASNGAANRQECLKAARERFFLSEKNSSSSEQFRKVLDALTADGCLTYDYNTISLT